MKKCPACKSTRYYSTAKGSICRKCGYKNKNKNYLNNIGGKKQ